MKYSHWNLLRADRAFFVDFAPTDTDTLLQKNMGFGISIDVDTININTINVNTDLNLNTDSEAHRFLQCMIFTDLSPISQASSHDDPATICNVCRKEFSSGKKLFCHIKETDMLYISQ